MPISYRYQTGGRDTVNRDYDKAIGIAQALWGHQRVKMPYGLTVIGY